VVPELEPQLAFRVEVLYRRLLLEQQGKIRIRHVLRILQELGLPHDKHKLPKAFWDSQGEFLLPSAQALVALVAQLRAQAVEAPDPLEHLFRYKLPHWLKEEFPASELLLYQHHFSLLDLDGNGFIDMAELQRLFAALGSNLTGDEAQTLIAQYDIDGGGSIDFVEFLVLIYKVQRGTAALQGAGLAAVLNEAKAQLHIFEAIQEVSQDPPALCSVASFTGSPVVCEVLVQGPADSAYAGGRLRVQVVFHDGYPYSAPEVRILDRIVAVNVMMQLNGQGRLLHLGEVWTPAWSLRRLLEHLVHLLRQPDVRLLPERFLQIYDAWGARLTQLQLERDGQRAQAPIVSLEALTSEELKRQIQALPRVEQMHLSALFLQLTDPAAFASYCRQIVLRYCTPSQR
jgi:ubiquitin-protein ligase